MQHIFTYESDFHKWLDATWKKVVTKLFRTTVSVGDSFFPYTTKNGKFINPYDDNLPYWWTDGFWTGILWKMYEATDDALYADYARKLEDKLDAVIDDFQTLHHDVGFMWLLSSVADYRLTGNQRARTRGLHMASTLAGRFNPNGNFIRAWNTNPQHDSDNTGWAIIDSMMISKIIPDKAIWKKGAGAEDRPGRFMDSLSASSILADRNSLTLQSALPIILSPIF